MRRTNADKWNEVRATLEDEQWQQKSDRAIAEHCGVSAPLVGKVRRELVESGTVNIYTERLDQKGRKVRVENIGTKPKKGKPHVICDDLHTPTYTTDQYQILAEKIHELEQEREGLRTEIKKLKQQLEDESYQRLRGEIRELEQNLAAKHKQMIDQRDKLWKEIKDLKEQRDKFERSYVHVAKELRAMKELLPDDDEVRSLPDAAELLQKLRGKSPKSKTNLRDVEELLNLITS